MKVEIQDMNKKTHLFGYLNWIVLGKKIICGTFVPCFYCNLRYTLENQTPLDLETAQTVIEYAGSKPNRHFSDDLLCKIFFWTVKIHRCSEKTLEALRNASNDIDVGKLRKADTWSFGLYGNNNTAMWWDKPTSKRPLISAPMPDSFSELYRSLVIDHDLPTFLTDCLVGAYTTAACKLNPHRDLFGEKFYGLPEHVFLIFFGARRFLAFHPHCRRKESVDQFLFKVECSSNIVVEILPSANHILVHTKLNAKFKEASFTISWRRGVPINRMRQSYPEQYKNICKRRRI